MSIEDLNADLVIFSIQYSNDIVISEAKHESQINMDVFINIKYEIL